MSTTVWDVMSAPPRAVHGADSVVAAARRLRGEAVAWVPVCGAAGEFLGALTAADIIDRCVAAGRDPRTTPVRSVLHGFGSVLHPADVLGSAVLNLILAEPLPSVPVLQDGRLVGILTVDAFAGFLLGSIDDDLDDTSPGSDPWRPTSQ
jgi:CBS domain-containing protein